MDDRTREPEEVRELRALADRVRAALAEPSRTGGRDLQHWRGLDAILDGLDGLERTTTRSIWNMQPRLQFDPEDPSAAAPGPSEDRGVKTVLITRPTTLDVNPLLPSMHPDARIGPVFLRGVVLDEERVVIEGLDTADGEPTAWLTDRPRLVVLVLELWQRTLALSVPVLAPGQQPLLSPRQLAGGAAAGGRRAGPGDRPAAGAVGPDRRARGARRARGTRRAQPHRGPADDERPVGEQPVASGPLTKRLGQWPSADSAASTAAPTMPAVLSSVAGTIRVSMPSSGRNLSAFLLTPPPTTNSSGEKSRSSVR